MKYLFIIALYIACKWFEKLKKNVQKVNLKYSFPIKVWMVYLVTQIEFEERKKC